MSNKVLTDKDIEQANLRFMHTVIHVFNYETQEGPAVCYALAPALRKIYPNDDDYEKALLNESKYFNSQPYMASLIIGAALGMEEQLGIEGADTIQNFKTGIMGPTAGIGDSLFWIILPAIFTPIEAALSFEGNYAGILIGLAYHIGVAIWRHGFFKYGYEMGTKFVTIMRDKVPAVTEAASILGLTVIGALIPSTVTVTCPLEYTLSTGSVINIQSLLDRLMPNLLSVVLAAVCAVLLGKKKVTMTVLVLVVLVFSIIMSSLGVLA